jgi:hypothetical protein
VTPQQTAARMAARAARARKEFQQSSRAIGIAAVKFTREYLTTSIYAIPEDVTKSGKKKWRRTGALRRGEQWELRGPFAVAIVNKVAYAEPRHEAGKRGRRKINPVRVSHWRDDLVKTFIPIVRDIRRDTLRDILRGRP